MEFVKENDQSELKYFCEIKDFNLYYIDHITFSEEMTIFNENFKSIGYIKSTVEKIEDCLLSVEVMCETCDAYVPPACRERLELDCDEVSSTSSSIIDFKTRLSVTALMNTCFNVYRERILTDEQNFNKNNEIVRYLVKIGDNYYFDAKINGHQLEKSYKKYSFCEMKNVITESVNLLVLKLIALNRYKGSFKAYTFDFQGNLCPCIYTAGPECIKYFRKEKIILIKVTREIFFVNGTRSTTSTILSTKTGRSVKHWWSSSNYTAASDPKYFLRDSYRCDKPVPIDILEKCPKISEFFADKVKDNMSEYKKYFENHPEIMNILNKFLKETLLRKPENLINFTLIFFSLLKKTVDKYP